MFGCLCSVILDYITYLTEYIIALPKKTSNVKIFKDVSQEVDKVNASFKIVFNWSSFTLKYLSKKV